MALARIPLSLRRLGVLVASAAITFGALAGPEAGAAPPDFNGPLGWDLIPQLTASTTNPRPGQAVTYDATVRLQSPAFFSVANVALTVTAPAGSSIGSVQRGAGSQATCLPPVGLVVRCTIAQLSSLQPDTIVVSTTAPATAGAFTATLDVDPLNTIREIDETNNRAAVTVRVPLVAVARDPSLARDLDIAVAQTTSKLLIPELAISRVGPSPRVMMGATPIDIEFDVQNSGSGAANGVLVRATMPQNLAIAAANLSGNACTAAGAVWSCTLNLPASSAPVRVALRIHPTLIVLGGSYTVTLSATVDAGSTFFELNEMNNTASVAVTVQG